jgi:hypothetical protein
VSEAQKRTLRETVILLMDGAITTLLSSVVIAAVMAHVLL